MSRAQQEIAAYADKVQADLDAYFKAEKEFHLADLKAHLYKDVEPTEADFSMKDGRINLSDYFNLATRPTKPDKRSTSLALSRARMKLASIKFNRSISRLAYGGSSSESVMYIRTFNNLGISLLNAGSAMGRAYHRTEQMRLRGVNSGLFINCTPSRSEALGEPITTAEAFQAMETISKASKMCRVTAGEAVAALSSGGVTTDEAVAALSSDRDMVNISSRLHSQDISGVFQEESLPIEKRLPVTKPPATQLELKADGSLLNWGLPTKRNLRGDTVFQVGIGLRLVEALPDDPEYYKLPSYYGPPVGYRDKDFNEWATAENKDVETEDAKDRLRYFLEPSTGKDFTSIVVTHKPKPLARDLHLENLHTIELAGVSWDDLTTKANKALEERNSKAEPSSKPEQIMIPYDMNWVEDEDIEE